MAVIYFQFFIVVTIFAAYLVGKSVGKSRSSGRKSAYWVSALWLVFTAVFVLTAPLLSIQIIVIIVTALIIRRISRDGDELTSLKDQVAKDFREFSPHVVEDIVSTIDKGEQVEIIESDWHHHALLEAIQTARSQLLILSGWVTTAVIDDDFERHIKDAVNRGVHIKIGFGWSSNRFREGSRPEVDEAIERLGRIENWSQTNVDGTLAVKKFQNHAKIIVRDEDYVICGSHNWLSNRNGRNFEVSHKISDRDFVERMRRHLLTKFDDQ